MDEQSYNLGNRAAWSSILQSCLRNLNYNIPDSSDGLSWILEREYAISRLRELCEKFGDNDWPDTLDLGDIIEKHLADYLYREK